MIPKIVNKTVAKIRITDRSSMVFGGGVIRKQNRISELGSRLRRQPNGDGIKVKEGTGGSKFRTIDQTE